MKFWTQEWWDEVKKRGNADPEYLENASMLTYVCQLIQTDAPGGVDRLCELEFDKGKIVKAELFEEKAPSTKWRTEPPDLEMPPPTGRKVPDDHALRLPMQPDGSRRGPEGTAPDPALDL